MENLNQAIEQAAQMISAKPELINDLKKGVAKSEALDETTPGARYLKTTQVKDKGEALKTTIYTLFPFAAPFLVMALEKSFGGLGAAALVLPTGAALAVYAGKVIDKVVNKKVNAINSEPLSENKIHMKKILLTESEKKAIILEREQAIVKAFAKTFNTIKRLDENELSEERPISARYGADPSPEQSAGIDKFVKDFLDKKDKEKKDKEEKSKITPNDTKISENDGEDYEAASRGVEYGINPYQEQPDMDEPQFDFVTSAIESASGDKVQKREEDDYGNPLYWSLTNRHIVYSIGGDNEDDIILYNGKTGERYPIGNLKNYK